MADPLLGVRIEAGSLAMPSSMPGGGAAGGLLIGMMIDWPAPRVPDGWLVAAGQAISRQVYAQLFEWYGTQFGAGDGETTFNLPDARGRTTVGLDVDAGSGYAQRLTGGISGINSQVLGAAGGNERLHQHTHGVYDPSHAHSATDHEHAHHDPTHAHTGGNHEHIMPNHQHGLWDPGHAHGVADGGHAHTGLAYPGAGFQGGGTYTAALVGGGWGLAISGSGANVGIYGSGTGAIADWGGHMWTNSGTGAAGSYGAYVGTWSDWRGTGIYGNYTGIWLYNAGEGGSQNVQPSLVVQKIIYTGVFVREP